MLFLDTMRMKFFEINEKQLNRVVETLNQTINQKGTLTLEEYCSIIDNNYINENAPKTDLVGFIKTTNDTFKLVPMKTGSHIIHCLVW